MLSECIYTSGGGSLDNAQFGSSGYCADTTFPSTVGNYYIALGYYTGSDVATVTGADIIAYTSAINDTKINFNTRFYLLKATASTIRLNGRWVDYAEISI